jgi:hypothetical protein
MRSLSVVPPEGEADVILVDHHVPMPFSKTQRYPWNQMEVGDSFFVKGVTAKQISSAKQHRQVAYPGELFAVRRWEDGYRVWRTA